MATFLVVLKSNSALLVVKREEWSRPGARDVEAARRPWPAPALAPLPIWLVERGYVDVLVSTAANATEDLLEARGTPFYQVEPDHIDDRELWQRGFYRFYDHVVSARE